jgi:hypothetical protein
VILGPCPCRNARAAEADQTPEFLLPNYNNSKNSDTPADRRRDRVQQNSFKKIAAGWAAARPAGARRRFVYMSDFRRLVVTHR